MYFDRCLTDITRLIGYGDVVADKALKQMTPLIERYGKERVFGATLELLDVDSSKEPTVTRLKADVRRFAFQLLGPPPPKAPLPPVPERKPEVRSSAAKSLSKAAMPEDDGRPLKQSRVYVIKLFQEWLKETELAHVGAAEMKRTNAAVKPYVGSVDFIVLRGDTKMLVTVRPHLQAKNLNALRELHKLFGAEYKVVRFWPNEASDGKDALLWREYPVDISAEVAS